MNRCLLLTFQVDGKLNALRTSDWVSGEYAPKCYKTIRFQWATKEMEKCDGHIPASYIQALHYSTQSTRKTAISPSNSQTKSGIHSPWGVPTSLQRLRIRLYPRRRESSRSLIWNLCRCGYLMLWWLPLIHVLCGEYVEELISMRGCLLSSPRIFAYVVFTISQSLSLAFPVRRTARAACMLNGVGTWVTAVSTMVCSWASEIGLALEME